REHHLLSADSNGETVDAPHRNQDGDGEHYQRPGVEWSIREGTRRGEYDPALYQPAVWRFRFVRRPSQRIVLLLNRSIICFGGEDWWYHHPHSKAHLMRKFARAGNKVIFVNSISMGLPGLAHKDLLPRIKRKIGSYSKLARQTEEGITVVSPASLPFFGSAAARAINRRAISAQIGRLARSRGLSKPILWIAIPTAAEMIGTLDESAVVYHVSDKYDANTMDHATDPALIRRLHEHAVDAADLVFYSGRKLFDEATLGRDRSYLLEQGVDYDHWQHVGNGNLTVAPEVARIPRPRLGYFGAIEPWLVDQ